MLQKHAFDSLQSNTELHQVFWWTQGAQLQWKKHHRGPKAVWMYPGLLLGQLLNAGTSSQTQSQRSSACPINHSRYVKAGCEQPHLFFSLWVPLILTRHSPYMGYSNMLVFTPSLSSSFLFFKCIATQDLAQGFFHVLIQEVPVEPQTPIFYISRLMKKLFLVTSPSFPSKETFHQQILICWHRAICKLIQVTMNFCQVRGRTQRESGHIFSLLAWPPGQECSLPNAASPAQVCCMVQGHQHLCSFPAPSHTSLSCSCSAESMETTWPPILTTLSKATCLENLNAESLTRAWSPAGLLTFQIFLESSCRSDSNFHPTASAEIRDQPRDQLSSTKWNHSIPVLSGEWGKGELSGIFLWQKI